jgi:hypothetical protein
MNTFMLLRLVFDLTAAAMLLGGLAYYWLDNTAHELIGTAMFSLLVAHNIFNRRWYRTAMKPPRARARAIDVTLTLTLLIAMAVLLVSSVLISRTVFGFLALDVSYTVRQIHMLAAHWVALIVSVHIGLRWSIVMNSMRNRLRLDTTSRVRIAVLRAMAFGASMHGVQASFEMKIGAKLFLLPVLDMWDFNNSASVFFLHYVSIATLYATISHYTMQSIKRMRSAVEPGLAIQYGNTTAHDAVERPAPGTIS